MNVALTGIPRSGTTLACHLLNKAPDTVALHEPLNPEAVARAGPPAAMCEQIERFFADTRESLLTHGRARSHHLEGQVPDNPVADVVGAEGLRVSRVSTGDIRVARSLTGQFTLVVKHNAMFTALLEELEPRLPCFALVRNPLAALASWNTVALPVQDGHAPAAERIDRELASTLGQIGDRIARQIHLLSWFFERFRRLLPAARILRYEDLVESGGGVLAPLAPAAVSLREALDNRNVNALYAPRSVLELGARLLESDGAYWRFYSRESVERLMADTISAPR